MTAINANGLLSQIEVKIEITGLRRLRWRMWLAAHIFRFGGWVSGLTTEVSVTTKTPG